MSDDSRDLWAAIESIRAKVEDLRVHGCSRSDSEARMTERIASLEERLAALGTQMVQRMGEIQLNMQSGIHSLRTWILVNGIALAIGVIGYLLDKFVIHGGA